MSDVRMIRGQLISEITDIDDFTMDFEEMAL
jgi:hypothetical protein